MYEVDNKGKDKRLSVNKAHPRNFSEDIRKGNNTYTNNFPLRNERLK